MLSRQLFKNTLPKVLIPFHEVAFVKPRVVRGRLFCTQNSSQPNPVLQCSGAGGNEGGRGLILLDFCSLALAFQFVAALGILPSLPPFLLGPEILLPTGWVKLGN